MGANLRLIRYLVCSHQDTYVIPSKDANCNGILHFLAMSTNRKCKHCWVAIDGQQKKTWRRACINPDGDSFQRTMDNYFNFNRIVYPIQAVGARPTSDCDTWKRRWPWHTRAWAVRQLLLQRMSRFEERYSADLITELQGQPSGMNPIRTIDQDTKGDGDIYCGNGELLEVVPLEDLEPDRRACEICRAPFIDDGDGDVCSGGGEVARRIPCLGGHVFGVECIVGTWKYATEHGQITECPMCRYGFLITVLEPRTFRSRIDDMLDTIEKNFHVSLFQARDNLEHDRQGTAAISPWQYILYSTAVIAALPTFAVVNHSMNIWNSKNGKLPYPQIAFNIAVGTIFQSLWLCGLLFVFPFLVVLCFFSKVDLQGRTRA